VAKNKKKYYVVWEGKQTGIFKTWDECQKNIKGAEKAFAGSYYEAIDKKESKKAVDLDQFGDEIEDNSISVDAACSGNPGQMEYRGVETFSGLELFKQGPYEYGTNNIGEFLALVHAIALLQKKQDVTIYSDSRTAMAWVRNKKVKTTLKKTKKNALIFEMIDRAEKYLKKTSYENPVAKWNTKVWGEIPADFGRK